MTLAPGARLGPYDVTAAIGTGGMSEVYKARDSRLGRVVVLKVLAPRLAADPSFTRRFAREARIISSLDHPHICPLYDIGREDGVDFLIMPFLEGETLAERCSRGPLPLDLALRYAAETCEALAAAHRKGIVHRDLKPANVMLAPGGVKLLDFGLARPRAAPVDPAAPTSARRDTPTGEGTLFGTLHYMAPELLEGRDADERSDIFAFGAVLYEMLAGRTPFDGANQAALITAIMTSEPAPLGTLRPDAAPGIDRLVRTCLAKDPDARFHSAHDVRLALDSAAGAGAGPGSTASSSMRPGARRRRTAAAMAAGVLLGAAAAWWIVPSPTEPRFPAVRASIALPPTAPPLTRPAADIPSAARVGATVAVSPRGTHIVYTGRTGDRMQLYLRALDSPQVLPLAEGGSPFFSPDGQWVAFFGGGELRKIPLAGGSPLTICKAPFGFGGVWIDADTVVFAGSMQGGLLRVSAAGGAPQRFTTLADGEGAHRWPSFIPSTRDVLFVAGSGFEWEAGRIAIQSLEAPGHRILLDGAMSPRWIATGHLVFARGGSLLAVPFDAARRAITGTARELLDGVNTISLFGAAQFATSSNGTLVYLGGGAGDVRRSLVWVDRGGGEQPLPLAPRGFETPRIAPDGERIAVTIREGDADVWVADAARGTLTRITAGRGEDHSAVWTPDGRSVTYSSTRGAESRLRQKAADGSGAETELFAAASHRHLGGWTADARLLLTEATTATGRDLQIVRVGESAGEQAWLATRFNEAHPRLSPDGRWLAYTSDESGRPEVYVQAFPEGGDKLAISNGGGREPVWAPDGHALYYRTGDRMLEVGIDTEPALRAGAPHLIFEGAYEGVVWGEPDYDVSPDGQRFLMIKSTGPPPRAEMEVIVNWFDDVARAVESRN